MLVCSCCSSSLPMIPQSPSCPANNVCGGPGFPSSIGFHFRRTSVIAVLTSACLCAFRQLTAMRGALCSHPFPAIMRSDLALKHTSFITLPVNVTEGSKAVPDAHPSTGLQTSEAGKPRRWLQSRVYSPPILSKSWTGANSAGLQNISARPSQPPMDVTFLFAPPPYIGHTAVPHAFPLHNEESLAKPPFDGSQIYNSSELGAGGPELRSTYVPLPESGASLTPFDFMLNRPKKNTSEYSSTRITEKHPSEESYSAVAVGDIFGGYTSENPINGVDPYRQRIFYDTDRETLASQLPSRVLINGQTRNYPDSTYETHVPREQYPVSVSSDGIVHASGSVQKEVSNESGIGVHWIRLPDISAEQAKAQHSESNSVLAPPEASTVSTSSSVEYGPGYNTGALSREAATSIFPALLGQLQPLFSSPFLGLHILAQRLLNYGGNPAYSLRSKHVIPINPDGASSAGGDAPPALSAPQGTWPFSYAQPLFSSAQLVGILPFLSGILSVMSLPQGFWGRFDPLGQGPPWRADAGASVSQVSGSRNTSAEIISASGTRSGTTSISHAQSARGGYILDYTPAVVESAPKLVSEGTRSADDPSLNRNIGLTIPALRLRQPLPKSNRYGNMTAPHTHPRPSHTIPPHVLPTEHLRQKEDLDSDMAAILNAVIQGIWRTASGPSSFMKVPPPLYSHRVTEEMIEEDALAPEEEEEFLQEEGAAQDELIFSSGLEEDGAPRAATSGNISDPGQSDYNRNRWKAISERDSNRPSAQRHSNKGSYSWDTLESAKLFALVEGVNDELKETGVAACLADRNPLCIPTDAPVTNMAIKTDAAHSHSMAALNRGTLAAHLPDDIVNVSNDIHLSPSSSQFLHAEPTARLRKSLDDCPTLHITEHQGGKAFPQRYSDPCLNLPSAEQLSADSQKRADGVTSMFFLQNPKSAISFNGAEKISRGNSHIADPHAREPEIPQGNTPGDQNTVDFWREEALSREEAPDSLTWYSSPSGAPPLKEGTAAPDATPPYRRESLTAFTTDQIHIFEDALLVDETVNSEEPWTWENSGEDFFSAFNGFPTPYDYYFPVDQGEEEDPVLGSNPQAERPLGSINTDGAARSVNFNSLLTFSANSTTPHQSAPEVDAGTAGTLLFSGGVSYLGGIDIPEAEGSDPAVDETHSAHEETFYSSRGEGRSFLPATEREKTSPDESAPFISKLSSLFRSFPLIEWLRLDPTKVAPFDWKEVFSVLIPMGQRIKRAKDLAHGIIVNEYCNRTAGVSTQEDTSIGLGGFAFDLSGISPPRRIQSDFEKCVAYYRTRTKEYINEYKIQCQDVWGDGASKAVLTRPITVDDVAQCLVQKYDVGRRWFNELFYQPWYRIINQTSYLLQAVDTAVTEFKYDAWFFPAAYSAANFGLWRACERPEDCFTGEKCLEALPHIFNFTVSFCHPTPESMNLDPITGKPLAVKFS